jgi:prepilin-type N-terminal cleavage/methylation domain-containing protein
MKSQKGFTLIEMVIVIAVMGTLMGLVFNGTRSVQANARDTRRQAELKQVQTYLELYYNKCNRYPGDKDCGEDDPTDWQGLVEVLQDSVADTGDIPEVDPSKVVYQYGVSDNGFEYVLGATMEKSVPVGGYTKLGNTYGLIDCGTIIYCLK